MSVVPVTQAIKTLWHATAVAQDSERLKKEQKAFLEACTKDSCLQTSGVSTKIPLSTHVKGMRHLTSYTMWSDAQDGIRRRIHTSSRGRHKRFRIC